MGHYYQGIDFPNFDYELTTVEGLGDKLFRGPPIDPTKPYIACVGAAQTYGRFAKTPYTKTLADNLGTQVLNLGVGGAGPTHFDAPGYLKWLNRADLVVLQVLSGRSSGNSLFDNREAGGLEGVRLTDGKRLRFEEFLDDLIVQNPELASKIIKETRESYLAAFLSLIQKINPPKILLWLSDRRADYDDDPRSSWGLLNSYPQLINRSILESLRPYCDDVVESVSKRGIPQKLWKSPASIDGATSRNGALFNHYYPTPEMHDDAAAQLLPVCRRFVPSSPKAKPAKSEEAIRFVVLGAERTGTNLLMGMLESHPLCSAANEVFNSYYIDKNEIPWGLLDEEDQAKLLPLRKTDPVQFLTEMFRIAISKGLHAAGCKLMYGQLNQTSDLVEYLISNEEIHIIHIRRRNLLRRYISELQARTSGVWANDASSKAPSFERQEIRFADLIWDLNDKEVNNESFTRALDGRNNVLEVHYENLADNPQSVGRRAARFLGLDLTDELEIRFLKTGTHSIADAVSNGDQIKSHLARWLSFFDN